MITELICFEPEVSICNGNKFEFKRESASLAVMETISSGSMIMYL